MRRAQTTLAGQARMSMALGMDDPRHRRRAQGFSGNQHFYVGFGLRIDDKGRLEVDANAIAGVICRICSSGPPGPPPPPPCDPLVDPCECCPAGLVCDPTIGNPAGCYDPTFTCGPSGSPIRMHCSNIGMRCENGYCVNLSGDSSRVGCKCGGGCDAIAWLGF